MRRIRARLEEGGEQSKKEGECLPIAMAVVAEPRSGRNWDHDERRRQKHSPASEGGQRRYPTQEAFLAPREKQRACWRSNKGTFCTVEIYTTARDQLSVNRTDAPRLQYGTLGELNVATNASPSVLYRGVPALLGGWLSLRLDHPAFHWVRSDSPSSRPRPPKLLAIQATARLASSAYMWPMACAGLTQTSYRNPIVRQT